MVEFRVYYDDRGDIICYTCEELEGNYLVIDSTTFAAVRYDVKVVDGKLVKTSSLIRIPKLVPADSGTRCAKENVCVIVSDNYDGPTTLWNKKEYEFRPN